MSFAASRQLYRWAMLSYPTKFRRRYAAEMEQIFVASLGTYTSRWRLPGLLYVWAKVLWDTAVRATTERVLVIRRKLGLGTAGRPPHERGTGLESWFHDLKFAVRTLRKSPAFTAVVVFSLALGIGATSTIFSAINPLLLRPPPFTDPDRLVAINVSHPERPGASGNPRLSTYLAWKEHSQTFEQLETADNWFYLNTYPGIDGAERNWVGYGSPGLFRLLGVEPILGRNFVAEDATVAGSGGAADGVIISHGFWQRRFGGDPDIVGQELANQVVVGVMPPGFRIFRGVEIDIWVSKIHGGSGDGDWMMPIGRLEPGVSIEQAQAELAAIARGLDQAGEAADQGWRVAVQPLQKRLSRQYASNLYLLMGAAVVLLMIACSNVASLLVGRATNRHREITTRAALGAGRLRLMRQMLTESIVLALLGGAFGVLMALLGTRLFVIMAPTTGYLPAQEIGVDGMVLGFTLSVSLLTVVLFGFVPALRASTPDLAGSLKDGARGSAGVARPLAHKLLVGSQIALTFVLLAGVGLMINSLVQLVAFDRGFNPERLVTAQVDLESERYLAPRSGRARALSPEGGLFYREILERLRAVPGVEAAEMASGGWSRPFSLFPGPALPPDEQPMASYNFVSPGFFAAMEIPLLRGRNFTSRDTENSPGVAIINETFARLHFPDQDPIGGVLHAKRDNPREIVGIVSEFRRGNVRETRPNGTSRGFESIYVPAAQQEGARAIPYRQLILKTSVAATSLAADLRRIVADMDPGVVVYDIETMQELLDKTVESERFWMRTLGIFATLALVLSVVGIYGVVSYAVAQRTHEIGVRMALGARQTDVLKMVVRQGMLISIGGVIVGVLGAVAATRLLSSWLYEVEATDPMTFATVAFALAGISLLATYLPARQAARVDPTIAIRSE